MKLLKNLFLTLAILIGSKICGMELPPKAASLQGLPSDLKLYLLPYIAGGNPECGIVKFASINKSYHTLINQPKTMIQILDALPYTARAIRLAENLQIKGVALPVMQSIELQHWLKLAKDRLQNGQKLVFAALVNNVNEVKTLLQNPNIHLNYFDSTGISPLIQLVGTSRDLNAAERQARLTILELLLNAGADPNAQVDKKKAPHVLPENMTALIWAAQGGQLEFVEKLLAAGANPDLKNKQGYTAFTIPSEWGVPEERRAAINKLLNEASVRRKKAAASEPAQSAFCVVQ